MANIAIFRINYKSDFILTLNSDAGWMTPFCIKFWTGAPSQAYFVGFDGTTYTHCAPVDGEPTKLRVQFDDHHLPIGDLKFQIGYHFTVDDFPTSVEDEVLNQASVIIEVDDAPAQVMLDLNGETAPEIEFSLPAYANEAQRIANEQARIAAEQQRIANEDARIQAEETRQYNEQQRIQHEEARVTEFDRLKRESEAATGAANDAATLANEKAQLAADKAALAQAAATLANEKAQLAADKAALAQDAADLANAKAALAQQKAEYAKAQGDYAKEQGIIAEEDHVRAEADHERAESDHATLENVPDSVPSTSPTDLSGNVEDVYLKNRSNNNPQAPRTLARLVTDSAKNRPLNESLTRLAEYQSLGFPAFSTSVSYAEGDPCFHDRRLYKAKAGGHSAGTWNAAHFEEFSVKEYTDAHVGIFDVSANNGGAVFASLQALLSDANLNTLIPAPFRRGGITITFIQGTAQSSDNKYVRYNLLAQSFTTDVTQWAIDDVGVYVESPEFVKIYADSQDRILWGIKTDGDIYFGVGVPTQIKDYIHSKIAELGLNKVEDIITFLGDLVEGDTLATLLNGKVDKVTGKSLINAEYAAGISYIESPEYVKLCVDSENKILEGIRNDGKQFLPLPSNQDDILQEQINAIKAQGSQEDTNAIPIDSQNLINPNACVAGKSINANGQLFDAATIYYSVSDYIPVNGRNILSNCMDNGAVSYGYAVYDESKGFIRVSTANNQVYNYQEGDYYIRLSFYGLKRYASYDTLPLTNIDYNEISGYLGKLDDSILPHKQELAIGNLNEYAVSRSVASYDVPSKEIDAYLGKDAYVGQDVVAVNHDDLNPTDYFGTRKIYNKYGFNADFNFILLPINQMSVFSEKIYNVRKLLKGGNTLGFHAYMNSSFWFKNKGFDIRPDSTFTYAPTFSDIRGTNPDGTGTNSFGYNVTSDTTFHDIGVFNGGVNENMKVVDATISDWLDTVIGFTVWGFRNNSTAIDLDGNLVTKTMLGWAEYWYNELIDNTLGYSTEGTIAERFAADYDVPDGASASDFYPDAEHLNNGTVIFFDDTDNAHYSEAKAKTDVNYESATYQLVGRFKRGFFKGAASTCNYEVMSRVLQMATAFCQHYFGMQRLSHVSPHGNRFFTSIYTYNGFKWEDKNHQILSSAFAYLYNTIEERFKNYKDITYENGIKASTFGATDEGGCFGAEGNFYGQEDFRGNSLNYIGTGGWIQILYLFEGLNGIYTYQEIYDKVMSFLPKNRYEWLSFIYNNANKIVTNADNESLKVSGGLKACIDRILSCRGTGRIPALNLDTINNSVNTSIAFEMLCQFCNEHNLKLITTRAASILCSQHRPMQYNIMPNTAFNQMALELGNLTPDGYRLSTGSCSVISETVDGNNVRVLKVYDSEKHSEVVTDIYGLTPGVYTFSCYIKTDDTTDEYDILRIEKCFNYQKGSGTPVYVYDKAKDGVYREVTVDFEVPAPYHVQIDKSTPQNQICLGYENNFHHISVILSANTGKYVSMYEPKIIVKY